MQCIIRLKENKVDNGRANRESVLCFFEFLKKPLWVHLEVSQMSKRKKCWMYFPARLIYFFWLVDASKLSDMDGWCFLPVCFWVMPSLHNPCASIKISGPSTAPMMTRQVGKLFRSVLSFPAALLASFPASCIAESERVGFLGNQFKKKQKNVILHTLQRELSQNFLSLRK